MLLLLIGAAAGAAWWYRGSWLGAVNLHFLNNQAGLRRVIWGPPESLGDNINTEQQEYEPCVRTDGSELYFVRGKTGGGAHIYFSARRENRWTDPVLCPAVNSSSDDLGPRLSADGQTLYFYSDRPGGYGGYDIWAARRRKDGSWDTPFNLGPAINSEFNEYSPDPTPDGRHLIFSTNRTAAVREQAEAWHATIRQTNTTDYDLWIAEVDAASAFAPASQPATTQVTTPAAEPASDTAAAPVTFKPAAEIPGVNTRYAEGASCMSPRGDFLYFASNRLEGYGKFDLYRCPVDNWNFGPVENLGPSINTGDNEMDPAIAMGGYRIYFSSDRPGGRGGYDLYSSDSREVTAAAHSLPSVGWSGVAMVASLALLVPLLLLLRGSESRYSLLQRCLLVSVLLHALFTFALSFIKVSQNVRQYVKQETGVDLALSLPKSVELALAVRNPRSSEGPQASDLPELSAHPLPPPLPRARAAVPLDAPLARVDAAGSEAPIALPKVDPPRPALGKPDLSPTAVVGALAPNVEALSAAIPAPHAIAGAEVVPAFTPAGGASAGAPRLGSPAPPPPRTGVEIAPLPAPPEIKPPVVSGDDVAVGGVAPIVIATQPSPSQSNVWASIGEESAAPSAGPTVSNLPALAARTGEGGATPPSVRVDGGEGDDALRSRTSDASGDAFASRFQPPQRMASDALSGGIGPGASMLAARPSGDLDPTTRPEVRLAPVAPPPVKARAALPQVVLAPPRAELTPHLIPPPTPFRRAPELRKPLIEKLGGTPESEAAVTRALDYLARQQEPDGRWTLVQQESAPGKRRAGPHDMAYTGLALLAFLAQNHTPDAADPFHETVRRGVHFLLSMQASDGDLRGPAEFRGGSSGQANLYDHAIATLALSETALLTRDDRLASAARAAARFIVRAQDPDSGGWRYAPLQSGDSSIFGWEVMAMHSVEGVGGFEIPARTRRLALRYIDSATAGRYQMLASYQPGGSPTQTMTAEMLFARMLLGERFSDEGVDDAIRFLAEYPPEEASPDLYYWYYASLCMVQMRTPSWSQWNTRTRDALVHLQQRGGFGDGAWEVNAKRVDRAGYIFTTAIATLTLEVYYRYAPALADSAQGR